MAKQMWRIKLQGVKADLTPARVTKDTTMFLTDETQEIKVVPSADGHIVIITPVEVCILAPHATIKNLWTGLFEGCKAHFSKKAIIAEIRYWN